jgi:hypothetical protein
MSVVRHQAQTARPSRFATLNVDGRRDRSPLALNSYTPWVPEGQSRRDRGRRSASGRAGYAFHAAL